MGNHCLHTISGRSKLIIKQQIMKKIFAFVFLIFMLVCFVSAQELTVDQIIEKHLKNTGYDQLQKVNSIIFTGHVTRQDYMPMKMYRKRPNKYMYEFDIQDMTAYQAYDGTNAWMTAPWTGNATPQLLSGDGANDLIARSDFDGMLYNWKEKGHQAELAGKEDYNGKEVYKVKFTRKDGATEYYYFDSKDFLLLKKLSYRKTRNGELEVLSMFSDYREINGIKFAFYTESLMGGQPYMINEYETIEIDPVIDDKVFMIPAE